MENKMAGFNFFEFMLKSLSLFSPHYIKLNVILIICLFDIVMEGWISRRLINMLSKRSKKRAIDGANNVTVVTMPRTRRRHHSRSRSRSRSHSHDRDREPKRRRVESPDGSHHRRSVSVDSESPSPQKTVKPVPDCDENSKKDLNTTVESTKDLNATVESTNDLNSTIESVDLNSTDTTNKLLNSTLELDSTSKKVLSPAQRKKHEEKMRLKQEREEQRLKERKEKEEQKKKEKEDRELQKRKEREEKEEQKRKEREEKEDQKRKEREEKEEQKRKEREEKEEQKRKEREEKEEQKRKEREEKELKKQQEMDEKNREKKKKEELMLKEKTAFVNFFVPRKSAGPLELKKPEEEKRNTTFMPFEVKSDMRVAPVIRSSISNTQKDTLTEQLQKQNESVLYLDEIKNGKKLGRFPRTWPVEDEDDDSVILLEETEIGERLDEEKPKLEKMRAKLLKFHENRRPAYFGTWRKKSKAIKSRKPLVKDTKFFDYEIDSDDDWEEEEPGEDIAGSDDEEKETEADDYEVDNDFFVPHGYLSDEEGQGEGGEGDSEEPQGEIETKLKILQEEFEKEMSSKTERIKPRLIGCIWENKLVPKVQDAIHQFLEDRMMIVCGPIKIQKRDLISANVKSSTSKNSTQNRKQLSQENIPDFLSLIHGNQNNQNFIVNEFISYLATKELDKTVSKASLFANMKRYAKWKKCPDDGAMHKKYCWYVDEKVRNQFNLKLELPNNWTYIGTNFEESNNSKRKLIV